MDRIINVKVGGNYLSKDNKNAGVRGESNVTKLRITFDEGWDGYAIKVIFWNARGLNPVSILLEPHLEESRLVYLVPIPAEPMKETGKLTFVIEGSIDDKVQRSLSDTLEVKESPIAENVGQPVPPTPDELTQVRQEIAKIKDDVIKAKEASADAATNATIASSSAALAQDYAATADVSASSAYVSCVKAEDAIARHPMITDGCWYVWDAQIQKYINTGVRAQAGSTVYMGDNPPADADVWINPDGKPDNYATIAYVEARLIELANKVAPSPASVTLYKNRWEQVEDKQKWYQEVYVENATITEYSKIDLQLSASQIDEFYGTAFVAENDNKTVTVFCFGSIPDRDVTIHAKVSEVVVNG